MLLEQGQLVTSQEMEYVESRRHGNAKHEQQLKHKQLPNTAKWHAMQDCYFQEERDKGRDEHALKTTPRLGRPFIL